MVKGIIPGIVGSVMTLATLGGYNALTGNKPVVPKPQGNYVVEGQVVSRELNLVNGFSDEYCRVSVQNGAKRFQLTFVDDSFDEDVLRNLYDRIGVGDNLIARVEEPEGADRTVELLLEHRPVQSTPTKK